MRNWPMFWGALAGITRGTLYLLPQPTTAAGVIDQLPTPFLQCFAAAWLLAGLVALWAAWTGRGGHGPARALGVLCFGWATMYVASTFVHGPIALSGATLYVVVGGLIWTKTRVVVVERDPS